MSHLKQVLPPSSYIARRSSAGLGLFAVEKIKKWQKIIEYIGEKITTKEADKRGGKYLFEVNSRYTIDGTPRWNTARYINHSCGANAEPIGRKDKIFIYAKKNIKPGEEITYNYGSTYVNEYIKPYGCRCAKCASKKKK